MYKILKNHIKKYTRDLSHSLLIAYILYITKK